MGYYKLDTWWLCCKHILLQCHLLISEANNLCFWLFFCLLARFIFCDGSACSHQLHLMLYFSSYLDSISSLKAREAKSFCSHTNESNMFSVTFHHWLKFIWHPLKLCDHSLYLLSPTWIPISKECFCTC